MATQFLLIGDLARIFNLDRHVIDWAVSKHGPEPAGRLGMYRCWSKSQLAAIRKSLDKTEQSGRGRPRQTAEVQ